MTQHTPGPWTVIPQSDGSSMIARQHETGDQLRPKALRIVAHVFARKSSLPEDEANAHLIAAAPDLLEALIYAESILDSYKTTHVGVHHRCLETVRAAIAKAKGTQH